MGFILGLILGFIIAVCMYTHKLVKNVPTWKYNPQLGKDVTIRVVDRKGNPITWDEVYEAANK